MEDKNLKQQKKYFGTDGVRGRVGEFPITPDFILKLGYAAAKVLGRDNSNGSPLFLIGKDTRLSGYMFESALEAGLAAAGADIALLGPMPTPAISYLTKTLRASAGIVISASHNCYTDNGIKFFSSTGNKLTLDQELEIEKIIDSNVYDMNPVNLGRAKRISDAPGRYIEFCKSALPYDLKFNSLKIVLDCANGATYHVAPSVFRELAAELIVINDTPNGVNINEKCGSTDTRVLAEKVVSENADLGIALDGDGDRVIMVDHKGNIVDGDAILYILAKFYKDKNMLTGGVVGTIMSNLGLEVSLSKLDIPFIRTSVGDKFIQQELDRLSWNLGGESSGHIICKDKISSGDGVIAALNVLHAILYFKSSLFTLTQEIEKFAQVTVNIPSEDKTVLESPIVSAALDKASLKLGTSGRVVLRASGTEPVIRLMAEAETKHVLDSTVTDLEQLIRSIV